MAIAFDAVSNVAAGTGNLSWTHVGVASEFACVGLIQNAVVANQVSGVTYGGQAMTKSVEVFNFTGETGCVQIWTIDNPTTVGSVTIVATVTGSASKRAVGISYTGTDIAIEGSNSSTSNSLLNPAITVTTGAGIVTLAFAVLFSGQDAITSVTPDAAWTEILEHDFGTTVGSWVRLTATDAGSNVTTTWTAAAEDATMAIIALRDDGAPSGIPVLVMAPPIPT